MAQNIGYELGKNIGKFLMGKGSAVAQTLNLKGLSKSATASASDATARIKQKASSVGTGAADTVRKENLAAGKLNPGIPLTRGGKSVRGIGWQSVIFSSGADFYGRIAPAGFVRGVNRYARGISNAHSTAGGVGTRFLGGVGHAPIDVDIPGSIGKAKMRGLLRAGLFKPGEAAAQGNMEAKRIVMQQIKAGKTRIRDMMDPGKMSKGARWASNVGSFIPYTAPKAVGKSMLKLGGLTLGSGKKGTAARYAFYGGAAMAGGAAGWVGGIKMLTYMSDPSRGMAPSKVQDRLMVQGSGYNAWASTGGGMSPNNLNTAGLTLALNDKRRRR